MDLEQLKAEHPAVYKQAVEIGIRQERDRDAGHITMGERVGDLRLALRAIRDGSELAELMPSYLQVGRNRRDLLDRVADDADVTAALEGIAPAPSAFGDPFEKQVLDRFEALLGRTDVDAAAIEDLEANDR